MRFTLTVEEIASLLHAEIKGDAKHVLHGINKIESASQDELSFLNDVKFEKYLLTTSAGCVLVKPNTLLPDAQKVTYIFHEEPHRALITIINHVKKSGETIKNCIHESAVIDESAKVSETAVIDAYAVVSSNCVIEENVHVHSGVVLQQGVTVGKNTVLFPNVVVYSDCVIGKDCIIHAGAVIGSDGFGYLENADKSFDKIPQIGNVVIGNSVEIGANSTIDRAALGSTVIGDGVKIDNLVHIAHNVEIGVNSAVAALSGIAGSAVIGAYNRLAGQVGIVGYVKTTENVIIGAQSGVSKNITKSGVYSGSPAVELSVRLKQEVLLRRLPGIVDELQKKND